MTGATPNALRLSWTVAQGRFSSFVIQYKDAQGQPRAVPVKGEESAATIAGLEPGRKYKMTLYGLHGRQRVGPVSVVATTGESGLQPPYPRHRPQPHPSPAPWPGPASTCKNSPLSQPSTSLLLPLPTWSSAAVLALGVGRASPSGTCLGRVSELSLLPTP